MVKLDKKDLKILYELDIDARIPNKALARKVGLSEQSIGYRINRLTKKGIIRNFILTIDPSKLGYTHYKLYLKLQNIPTQKESELVNFLIKNKNTTWVVSLRGNFDFVVSIWAKDLFKFQEFYQKLKDLYGIYISDENLVLITNAPAFNRSYLLKEGTKIKLPYGGKKGIVKIDEIDSKILSTLSNNARLNFIEIGKLLNINPDTIRYRINKLKKEGIITGSRITLNNRMINRDYIIILLNLQNFNQENLREFELFSKNFDAILYFIDCIGSHNAEIEAEISADEEFDKILKSFKDKFFDNINSYSTLEVVKEYKLNFYPF